jgi:hypothetical protein
MRRPLRALLRRLLQSGAGLVLLATTGCTPLPPTAAVVVPPIPAGQARAWFYRDAGPYDCLGTPYIRMNEGIVAVSQLGGASYRDVPPGQYLVTVDSYLTAPDQTRNVYLFPSQQAYFKIVCLRNWVAGGGSRNDNGYMRDTFYVWQIPPEVAQGDVARSQFYGGG